MHTRVRRRYELRGAALEPGVDRDEIGVYYQPIVCMTDGPHASPSRRSPAGSTPSAD